MPVIIEAPVRLVIPGTRDDYFATEVVRLFGLEAPDYEKPQDPGTFYYRLGSDRELAIISPVEAFNLPSGISFTRDAKTTRTLLTQIVTPLQDPSALDRGRVEYWKSSAQPFTAFAVSVLDNQSPAMYRGDKDYPFEAQMLLTHCLLDGHHRVQAAADADSPIRILSFVAGFASNVSYKFDYTPIFEKLGARVWSIVRWPIFAFS